MNKNTNQRKNIYYDENILRKDIRKLCQNISLYSIDLLEFIYSKNGDISHEELVDNFPELQNLSVVDSIMFLWFTLQGKLDCFPDHLRYNKQITSVAQSQVKAIVLEEIQILLLLFLPIQKCVTSSQQQNQKAAKQNQQYGGDQIQCLDDVLPMVKFAKYK